MPTSTSIGFNEAGPHDLGLRLPLGEVTLANLAPDTTAAINSAVNGFNTIGNIRNVTDDRYLGWDASNDRFGFAKRSGQVGHLAYATGSGYGMDFVQYAGNVIDPLLSTPTVRASFDQAGRFNILAGLAVTGVLTRNNSQVLAEDRAATTVSTAVGSAVGVALNYAREDHSHGVFTPSYAGSVTSEQTYGISPAVGTTTNLARADHTHGSPTTPVTSAVSGTGIAISGATGSVTFSNTGVLTVVAGSNISVTAGQNPAVAVLASPTFTGTVTAAAVVRGTSPVVAQDNAATTVSTATASAVGTALTYSREDHSHGAFVHGRFHRDFYIAPQRADLRYDNWLRQLLAAHTVYGLYWQGALAGFIGFSGSGLVLHAVAEAFRGRGLAKYWWSLVVQSLFEQGHAQVSSSISASNVAVMNLYSSLGFSYNHPQDIYHRLVP